MVREQFTNACSKELSVYLNERSPKTLDELVTWAEQYLMAHNKKLSSLQSRQEDVKNGSIGGNSERALSAMQCFRRGGKGHRSTECVSRMPDGRRREGERYESTKGDFHARSVAVMGMKPEIVALRHAITMHSFPDQTEPSLHHRCIVRDVRLRFESCLE